MSNSHLHDNSLKMAQGIVRSFMNSSAESEATESHDSSTEDSEILKAGNDFFELVVTSPEDSVGEKYRFHDSFVLIGRSADCDLSLPDDCVSKRHAYLQKIFGRIVCVDLASSNGIYWPEGRRPFGWFDDERSISIGKYHLRLVSRGPAEEIAEPEFDPGSFFKTDLEKPDVPRVSLQYLSQSGEEQESWVLSRTITLVGASSCCKLRLQHDTVSRVHCSLLLLPEGLWIIDLLGQEGTFVNNESVRSERLADGDVFQVGKYAFRVKHLPPEPVSADSKALIQDHSLAGKVISNEFAGKLLEQVMTMQQQFLHQSQQQTEMMLQFFGTLQTQQHELLSQEMARVRGIDEELRQLRQMLAQQSISPPSQSHSPAAEEEASVESPHSGPRRLKHIRTAGPPPSPSPAELRLDEASWKLTQAAEAEQQPDEPLLSGDQAESDHETLLIESQEEMQRELEELSVEAEGGQTIDDVPRASVADSISNPQSPNENETDEESNISEIDGNTSLEAFEDLEESDDELEQASVEPSSNQRDSQSDVDHHAWVLSRMHQLERERDGIFRKMLRAVFKPNS